MLTAFRSRVVETTRFDYTLPHAHRLELTRMTILHPQPPPSVGPEDVELTRTPNGTARQVGAGFFAVSSYVSDPLSLYIGERRRRMIIIPYV